MFETETVNMIVSDLEMPGLNGLDLLRQIRSGQTSAPRDIGFIILTSHSDTEVLGSAMALDVDAFIVKPFTTRLVVDKVTRTREHRAILRSENEYTAVVTDLESLRSTRLLSRVTSKAAPVSSRESRQMTLPIPELQRGMRVANDVTATDGTIIIAAGTVLTAPLINLLSDLKEVVFAGDVTVYDRGSV
jgi:YesN/AraC family two-component response regulator